MKRTPRRPASWLENYLPGLRRYFSRRVPTAEVEPLLQEVVERMQLHSPDEIAEQPDRYLFTVAAGVLDDRARRAGQTEQNAQPLPGSVLSRREASSRVASAIAELPQQTRDVLVLHRFGEMTCAAVASTLGIRVGAVERQLSRAMQLVSTRLETDAPADEQAVGWFARQRTGAWAAADARAFALWLEAAPAHVAAYTLQEQNWQRLASVSNDPEVLAIREKTRLRAARKRMAHRRRIGTGLTAAVLLVLVVFWATHGMPLP